MTEGNSKYIPEEFYGPKVCGTELTDIDEWLMPSPSSYEQWPKPIPDHLVGVKTELATYLGQVESRLHKEYRRSSLNPATIEISKGSFHTVFDAQHVGKEFEKFIASLRSNGIIRPQKVKNRYRSWGNSYIEYSKEDLLTIGALWDTFNLIYPDTPVNDINALLQTREQTLVRLGDSSLAAHLKNQESLPDYYPKHLRRKVTTGEITQGETTIVTKRHSRVIKIQSSQSPK